MSKQVCKKIIDGIDVKMSMLLAQNQMTSSNCITNVVVQCMYVV